MSRDSSSERVEVTQGKPVVGRMACAAGNWQQGKPRAAYVRSLKQRCDS